jgi:hypothetical protein
VINKISFPYFWTHLRQIRATIPMILVTMIPTIETIPAVFVQKESLLVCPEAGALVAEAPAVIDAPFIDVERGIVG